MRNILGASSIKGLAVVENGLPAIVSFDPVDVDTFAQWYHTEKDILDQILLTSGAILFRGIQISSVTDFEIFTNLVNPVPFDYTNGNSPRTKLTSKVYTSTEYDRTQSITLHNELSYASKWPKKLFFCCITPAIEGGETPIADSRKILQAMDKQLVDEIRKKKIKYIRNLHGGAGLGPSWQHTFETTDKNVVAKHCLDQGITFEWKSDGGLKLIQVSEGIVSHPVSQEEVWFNQIDQFHPCHLPPATYESLLSIYQDDTELPMYVCFGDDSNISESTVNVIQQTISTLTVNNRWKAADLLLVDNVLVCHGRKPFRGSRKIVVSMI